MIYACPTSARYSMRASIFEPVTTQNPDTGEFERGYALSEVVSCYATGIAASGKDVPGVFETYNRRGEYGSTDFVRLSTKNSIPKQAVISNITSSNGVIFLEDDGVPTIYDSNGSVPIVNASGSVVEYVTMLTRAEVQNGEDLA